METVMEDIWLIYDKLADDISKEIFINRLAYNMTGDRKWIKNVIKAGGGYGKEFLEKINWAVAKDRKLCIFGSGAWGKNLLDSYPDIVFSCFIDNDIKKCNKSIKGLPIIFFDDWMKKNDNSVVIISSRLYHEEQYAQLIEHKIPEERIINAGKMIDNLGALQYFDLPKLKELQLSDEVFVDVGSFDGKTSAMFARWAGEYKKIYVMEPEPDNRVKCVEVLKMLGGKYDVLPFGAWDKAEKLSFSAGLNGSSHVIESKSEHDENKIIISVNKIDDLIREKVSFIKMDVEGAELKALFGAENLIKKYKPKLAICVYHRKEDILKIPKLILSYVPAYRFYLRHYCLNEDETVLYCVIE